MALTCQFIKVAPWMNLISVNLVLWMARPLWVYAALEVCLLAALCSENSSTELQPPGFPLVGPASPFTHHKASSKLYLTIELLRTQALGGCSQRVLPSSLSVSFNLV